MSRNFHASAPDELWLTDITEFRLPYAKVYLSAIIDCFDGKCISWSIGRHSSKQLANSSLTKALSQRRPKAHTTIHSDRGGHHPVGLSG
ncbi:MAG: transposase family protein [Lancefieldella rimae]|uniref:Transposase family protein n=1 Tax=Lancefieldella rimae TaxID=1383 RepID=A0A930W1S3_9ACTN|nr:transposase family protein [Lancefieldella rimae]